MILVTESIKQYRLEGTASWSGLFQPTCLSFTRYDIQHIAPHLKRHPPPPHPSHFPSPPPPLPLYTQQILPQCPQYPSSRHPDIPNRFSPSAPSITPVVHHIYPTDSAPVSAVFIQPPTLSLRLSPSIPSSRSSRLSPSVPSIPPAISPLYPTVYIQSQYTSCHPPYIPLESGDSSRRMQLRIL